MTLCSDLAIRLSTPTIMIYHLVGKTIGISMSQIKTSGLLPRLEITEQSNLKEIGKSREDYERLTDDLDKKISKIS